MGEQKWDSLVFAYASSIQEVYPALFLAKRAEILAMPPHEHHVDEETQNELFRLDSRLHGPIYSHNPQTGAQDFLCTEFIYATYADRHQFNA